MSRIHDLVTNGSAEELIKYLDLKQNQGLLKNLFNTIILRTQNYAVHKTNEKGETALHCAVREGNKEMVKILIDRGANIEAKNNLGETPLFYAARLLDPKKEIHDFLISRGANASAINNKGETAYSTNKQEQTELFAENLSLNSLPSHVKSKYEINFEEIGPGQQRQGLIKTLRLDEISFLADVPDSIPIADVFEGCELFIVPDFDKNWVPKIQSDAIFLTNDNKVYIYRNKKLVINDKKEPQSFTLNVNLNRFGLPKAKPQDAKKQSSFAHVDNRAIQKRQLVKHIESLTKVPFHPEYTRYSLRPKAKKRFAIRGHQIVDRYVDAYEKAKTGKSSQAQFTHDEKENYTKKQPCSYYDLDREQTSTFGFDKRQVLIGIKDFGGLIGGIYGYDLGSVGRPNERDTEDEAKERLAELIERGKNPGIPKHYDTSQLEDFTKEGFNRDKHNELLVRLNWNPKVSSVCVIHDNFESRCAAYALADRLNKRLIPLGLPKAPISYHTANQKIGLISEEQRQEDTFIANRIFRNQDDMKNKFQYISNETANLEFLLLVDVSHLTPEFFFSFEFKELFRYRSYIAEMLIQKYITMNNKPVELPANFFDNIVNIMPRSIIEKISSNAIIMQKQNNDKKNTDQMNETDINTPALDKSSKLIHFEYYYKFFSSDFSGLNLSKIDLAKKEFQGVNLSLVNFNSSIIQAYFIENCDLRASNFLSLLLEAKKSNSTINVQLIGGCKLFNSQKELNSYIDVFKDDLDAFRGLDLVGFDISSLPAKLVLSLMKDERIYLDNQEQIKNIFDLEPTFEMILQLDSLSDRNIQTLKYMFEKIDLSLNESSQALNWAIHNGLTEIATDIIKKKSLNDISENNSPYSYPLQLCVKQGNKDLAALLIENGADIESKNGDSYTALHLACITGNTEIIDLLIEHNANIDNVNNDNHTALLLAAKHGQINSIKKLIDKGAKINDKNEENIDALHVAITSGNIDTVKFLLENVADINVKYDNNRTALHLAALSGKAEIISILIDKGAQIEEKDKKGMTALHLATISGNTEAIMLLLKRGAAIDNVDDNQCTALLLAAKFMQTEAINLLLDEGADIFHCAYRENVLDIALRHRTDGIVAPLKLLIERGADITNIHVKRDAFTPGTFSRLIEGTDPNEFQKLLEAIPTLDQKIVLTRDAIKYYNFKSQKDAARNLLVWLTQLEDQKINLNLTEPKSYTPMHNAASHKNSTINTQQTDLTKTDILKPKNPSK